MTQDEKFEALLQRVDALTQSVELLHHMHQDHLKEHEERFDPLLKIAIRLLANHGDRLDDLEQGEN